MMRAPAVARLDALTGLDQVEAIVWAHGVESPVLRVAVRVLNEAEGR